MTFDEFADTSATLFGLDAGESNELASRLDDAGLEIESYDVQDADFWADVSDATDEFFFEDIEMYNLDPYFPGDEYLDAGIEWELTAESEEGYGDD